MSAVLARAVPASPWRWPLAALGAAVLAVLGAYRATFEAMVSIWSRSDTFAHAFLVPPIALWLAWRLRGTLATLSPRPCAWALLPMALAGLLWLAGDAAGVNALTQFAATAMLVLAVPAVLGTAVSRVLLFPLAFLFFMVPFGEFAMPLLMQWTADFTVMALRLFGVPVYREGLNFVIPTGNWSVVEACSGVRYLIASFMVGSLFAYLNFRSPRRRWAFAAVSLVVPVVANWLRAVMIVMLGHLSNNQIAVGVDHLIYGWLFFGVVVALMFYIGGRWSDLPVRAAEAAAPTARTGAPAAAVPWAALAGVLVVALLPPLLASRLAPAEGAPVVLALPDLPGAPVRADLEPLQQPWVIGPRATATRVYGGELPVTVHVAFFRNQTYGRKLVNANHALLPPERSAWTQVQNGPVVVGTASGPLAVRSATLREGGLAATSHVVPVQVRQVYWVAGRFAASDTEAALLGLYGRLTGGYDDAALITLYAAADDTAAASRALDAFAGRQLPLLSRWLDALRAPPA